MILFILDGAFPTKGSGKQYNSNNVYCCFVDSYSKKVINSQIHCCLFQIFESTVRLGRPPIKHDCIKNYDCLSKRMEYAVIVEMVKHNLEQGFFFTGSSVTTIQWCATTLHIWQHQKDKVDQNLTKVSYWVRSWNLCSKQIQLTNIKCLVKSSMTLQKHYYVPQDSPIKWLRD